MKSGEFIKRVQRYAKRNKLYCHVDWNRGKGSHGVLFLNSRSTTVKDRKKEVGTGLLTAMLTDLGLTRKDVEQ